MLGGLTFGQTNLAVIRGTVLDPSGSVVSGAAVRIVDADRGAKREVSTDAQGDFAFVDLPPRRYNVTVSKTGFQTWVSESVILNGSGNGD